MDHAKHKVWDDAKPLEQKFPRALVENWKMREANAKVRREKARDNNAWQDPLNFHGLRGTGLGNFLPQVLWEAQKQHEEFLEWAARPRLSPAQIKKQWKMQDAEHPRGPTRANIFTGLSGLAQEMQNR